MKLAFFYKVLFLKKYIVQFTLHSHATLLKTTNATLVHKMHLNGSAEEVQFHHKPKTSRLLEVKSVWSHTYLKENLASASEQAGR